MSTTNVVEFLTNVASRPDILESLKVRSKDNVVTVAARCGFPFTEDELDAVIWDLRHQLAGKRSEQVDATFPLCETMWGRCYLEHLVIDLIPSAQETRLVR